MTKLLFGSTFFLLNIYAVAQQKPILNTPKDSASYAAGLIEGERMTNMMQQGGADTLIDLNLFLNGFNDYIKNLPAMNRDAANDILTRFFSKLQEQAIADQNADMEKFQVKYIEQKEAGEKFLTENKNKPGVKENASGLQFKIVKKGKGDLIKFDDKVKVYYTGTFTDGTEFDSNRGKEPFEFEFTSASLIPGWTEILQMMKPGSQYTVYLPYNLGYGEKGTPPAVPPYSVLIFDIEVVSVQKN